MTGSRYQVSLVIPVYNVAPYLAACLRSVFAQVGDVSYEVIVVDDGSTDESANIAQREMDGRPNARYVRQPNAGVGAARNRGVQLATADIIGFVDSDDMVAAQFVAALAAPLLADPEVDISVCDYCQIANDDVTPNATGTPRSAIGAADYLLSGDECYLWNKMFRASLLRRQEFYPGRFEDLSVVPFLLAHYRSAYTAAQLYFYRLRTDSLTSDRPRSRAEVFHIFGAVAHLQKLGWQDTAWREFHRDRLPVHLVGFRLRELMWSSAANGDPQLLGEFRRRLQAMGVKIQMHGAHGILTRLPMRVFVWCLNRRSAWSLGLAYVLSLAWMARVMAMRRLRGGQEA